MQANPLFRAVILTGGLALGVASRNGGRRPLARRALVLAAAIAFAFGFGFVTAPTAEAHNIGWVYNKTSITVWHGNTTYASTIQSAMSDYTFWTKLSLADPGCADFCNIVFNQASWPYGWQRYADAYNSIGDACAQWPNGYVTGLCNNFQFSKKADHGYVYLNTNYFPYGNPNWIMRHELGHHFGLAHVECTTASVMQDTPCSPPYTQLQPHDISDINALY